MNDLTRPSRVAELLAEFKLSPHKGLGQNFLVDRNALEKIISLAEIDSGDTCIEVGPGLGTLTRELAARAKNVIAVEKDKKLSPVLAATLAECANVRLYFEDALEVAWHELLSNSGQQRLKVVANLPYYVTTPLVMAFLESPLYFERIVVLVQKEVALRMASAPAQSDYGALSVAVQYHAEVQIGAKIAPTAFFPPPKVASSVVVLKRRANPAAHYGLSKPEVFFKIVRAAFGQRRKTLRNALLGGDLDPSAVRQTLEHFPELSNARGEELSVQQFVLLSNTLEQFI